MRKIIDGTRYDTNSAILVAEYETPKSRSDFSWWKAGLYRTKISGRYFLAGEGGPMTIYGQPCQGGMTYGDRLTPMGREEALAWAEQYLTTEEIEAEFAGEIQDA